VWVYCPQQPAERLGPLPGGFSASDDWAAIIERITAEQGGRSDLRALVYCCAPLQVLE
jgi:hypothetical protein